MKADVRVDALVRGPIGTTGHVEAVRVTSVSPFGWVAGVNSDGRQRVLYTFDVVDAPRPVAARTDIPERLRT